MPMTTKTTTVAYIVENATAAGHASLGAMMGASVMLWLSENATAIGALGVIIGIMATIGFKILAYQETVRHNKAIEDE
tara:strand:- start:19805 stop:20038 length:234 start_codon:yes stop_codon:yes gene_type:complete